jgi:hypothetical protein
VTILPAGSTAFVDDERRHWLERLSAAARLQAEALRSGDGYYHEALLEDLDDLCRRIDEELERAPKSP